MRVFIAVAIAATVADIIQKLVWLTYDKLPPRRKDCMAYDIFIFAAFVVWGVVLLCE